MPGLIQSPIWAPGLNASQPIANGLAAHWPTWEGDGDKVMDVSGNGNDGTLTNMDPATDWVKSPMGGALHYDGTGEYVATGATFGDVCTYSAWINFDTLIGEHVTGRHDGADHRCWMGIYSVNFFYIAAGDSSKLTTAHGGLISADEWHLWTLVLPGSGGSARLYIDGILRDTVAYTFAGRSAGIDINYRNDSFDIIGDIGPATLWERALSPNEIQQLYSDPDILTRKPRLA